MFFSNFKESNFILETTPVPRASQGKCLSGVNKHGGTRQSPNYPVCSRVPVNVKRHKVSLHRPACLGRTHGKINEGMFTWIGRTRINHVLSVEIFRLFCMLSYMKGSGKICLLCYVTN